MNTNIDTIDTKLAAPMGSVNAITSSASPLFDLSRGHVHRLVLTMNANSPLVQNPVDGQPYKFIIKQNSVGGFSFTFPSSFKGAGKIQPSEVSTAPNTTYLQVFTWVTADSAFYPWGPMTIV